MSVTTAQTQIDPAAQALLERARERAQTFGLYFAGLLYPPEAWVLAQSGAAVLIDVRTPEELRTVGRVPDVPHIAWKSGPEMALNPHFAQQVAAIVPRDANILLLCRSGIRSAAAAEALTQAGFANAFNILEGFEGELDADQQRGTYNGWKFHRLPWTQD